MRTIGGIPVFGWALGVVAIIGGVFWFRKQQGKSGTGATPAASTPQFSQAQEVQDFQIFSSLTSQQQASDEAYVGQLVGLFSGGGSSTAAGAGSGVNSGGGGGGGSSIPSPSSTGTTPPATAPATLAYVQPGQAAGLGPFYTSTGVPIDTNAPGANKLPWYVVQ